MNFQFAAHTDPGLMRENNEDFVSFDTDCRVAVLADGMGGYNAGEIASAMAVTFVKAELTRWLSIAAPRYTTTEVRRALEACVINANQSIYNAANANQQFRGMGTTLVAGVFDPKRVLLAHVGDSRCYVWRDSKLVRLTKDHSLLQEQLDAGLITPEQAKVATHKNLVTRALGVEEGVNVDLLEHHPVVGDVYLMCSDGLTDMVADEELAAIFTVHSGLEELASALILAANQAGGRDNISVILIGAKAKSGGSGFFSRVFRKA